MSTAAFEVPPQLVSFKPVKRSFTILNSGPKEKSPMFIGNLMTIPAVNTVGPYTDTDADGDPIPGTRVIEDLYVFEPDLAMDVMVFDAVRAVCHILGLQPGSDGVATLATSPFALNGMSLLPRHAPKSQWKAMAAAGEHRAFGAEVERARIYLASVDETNAIRKANNLSPSVPNHQEYRRAQWVIGEYEKLMEQETKLAPHQADQVEADLEFEAYAKVKVMELAEKVAKGKSIDKVQLATDLLSDPDVLARLRKTHRIRKVGEMPQSKADLDKAAEAQLKSDAAKLLEDDPAEN